MSVAKVIEISAASPKSFEEAINEGLRRAAKTVNNMESAWIKSQQVSIENNQVASYRVILKITFVLT
jgi:flavin-binding protein dodecin